ncbi:hypothetical protein DFQ26_008248, partial [Actinomortierella ambigua]
MNNINALLDSIQETIGAFTACCLPTPTLSINRRSFKVIKLLGEGGFSFVYLVQDVATGRLYALKKIRCPFGSEGVQDAMKEAEMYRTFQHENLVRMVDTCVVTDKDGSKIVYIFLPYYKRGNLLDAISANLLHHTHFSEVDMLRFFRGVCYGVRALHAHRLPNVPVLSREQDEATRGAIEAWDSRDRKSGGNGSMRRQGSNMSFQSFQSASSPSMQHPSSSSLTVFGEPTSPSSPSSGARSPYGPNGYTQQQSPQHHLSFDHTSSSSLSGGRSGGGQESGDPNEQESDEATMVPFAHRDIKPANVLIADDGQTPVLMDFGSMARARVKIQTRQQALFEQDLAAEQCSMPYRAPELFDVKTGATLDEKVDIW